MEDAPKSQDLESSVDRMRIRGADPAEDSLVILALPDDAEGETWHKKFSRLSFRRSMELRVLSFYRKVESGEIHPLQHFAERRALGFLGFWLPLFCVEILTYILWDIIGPTYAISLMVSGFLLFGFAASRWEHYTIPARPLDRTLEDAPPGSIVVACRLPEKRRADLRAALEGIEHHVLFQSNHAGSVIVGT